MGFFSNIGKFFNKSAKSLSNPVGYLKNLGSAFSPNNAFSDFDGNLGLLGNVSGDMQDFWDSYTGRDVAMKNYELQKNQFEYQQQLNKEQQTREDNAMQRKVADLKAAGLNPILAANGTGAASAPLKAAPAPQIENTSGAMRETLNNAFQGMLQVMSLKKDFAEKDATIKFLLAQKDKVDAEAAGIRTDNRYKDEYLAGRNKAQNLSNEWSEKSMSLRISELTKNLDIQDLRKIHYEFENEIAKLGVSGAELDNIAKSLNIQSLRKKIELDVLALLYKTQEYEAYKYSRDFYENQYHVPTGFNLSSLFGSLTGVGNRLAPKVKNFMKSLSEETPRNPSGFGGTGASRSWDSSGPLTYADYDSSGNEGLQYFIRNTYYRQFDGVRRNEWSTWFK